MTTHNNHTRNWSIITSHRALPSMMTGFIACQNVAVNACQSARASTTFQTHQQDFSIGTSFIGTTVNVLRSCKFIIPSGFSQRGLPQLHTGAKLSMCKCRSYSTPRAFSKKSCGFILKAASGSDLNPTSTSAKQSHGPGPLFLNQWWAKLRILWYKMFTQTPQDDAQVARLALPSIFTVLLDPFLTLVDTYYVARLGTAALASLSSPIALLDVIFCVSAGLLSIGPAVLTSSAFAKKDLPAVGRVIAITLVVAMALSTTIVCFLCYPGVSYMLISKFGSSGSTAIQLMSMDYLKYRVIGIVASCFNMSLAAVLRGMEDTRTVLKGSVAAGIVNIVLDPIFITNLNMGVGGAALATSISQWAATLVYLTKIFNKRHMLHLEPSNFQKTSFQEVHRFALSGGPLVFRQTVIISLYTIMAYLAIGMGPLVNAGYRAFASIRALIAWMTEPINIAAQVMIVQKRTVSIAHARDFALRAIGLTLIASFVIMVAGLLFFPFYGIQAITGNLAITQQIRPVVIVYLLTSPIGALAFNFDSYSYGLEDYAINTKITTVATLIGILFMLATAYLWHGGLMGLYGSTLLLWIMRCIFHVHRLFFDSNGPMALAEDITKNAETNAP